MPKLILLVNIGTADAQRLGLDHTAAGQAVDVKPAAAEFMVAKGWACDPKDAPEPEPATFARAPIPVVVVKAGDVAPAVPATPDIDPATAPPAPIGIASAVPEHIASPPADRPHGHAKEGKSK